MGEDFFRVIPCESRADAAGLDVEAKRGVCFHYIADVFCELIKEYAAIGYCLRVSSGALVPRQSPAVAR